MTLPTFLHLHLHALPLLTIIGYIILSQSSLSENYIDLNVLC